MAAVHGLFAGDVWERLVPFPIEKIFVSDSLCRPAEKTIPLDRVGIGECLAGRIETVSGNRCDDLLRGHQ